MSGGGGHDLHPLERLGHEAAPVDGTGEPVSSEHHVHTEQRCGRRRRLGSREVLVAVLPSRRPHRRDRARHEPPHVIARDPEPGGQRIGMCEAHPLGQQQEVGVLAGDVDHVGPEARMGRADRVHRPAGTLHQAHEARQREPRLPRAVDRARLVGGDAGTLDQTLRAGLDRSARAGAERGEDLGHGTRRDVREPLGGQEGREARHIRGRDLLVEHGLERRAVTRMHGPSSDQPDALTLDEVRERAGAALARSTVVGTELDDAEAGPRVRMVHAEHLADELLPTEQRRVLTLTAPAPCHDTPGRGPGADAARTQGRLTADPAPGRSHLRRG